MTPEQAAWHRLLLAAARLQQEIPGAVLVGGSAVALTLEHRFSTDADHVVADLKGRYDQVRLHLERLEGWSPAKYSKPPVLILGSLDGTPTGVRQLRRAAPLETQEFNYSGQTLCIPTYNELLRIKAYLLLTRNYSRDYVDFLALSAGLELQTLKAALTSLDTLYGPVADAEGRPNLLFDLGMALKAATPKDADREEWNHFDAMHAHDRPWDLERIRHEGRPLGERVLALWRALADNDESWDADTLRERDSDTKLPRRRFR